MRGIEWFLLVSALVVVSLPVAAQQEGQSGTGILGEAESEAGTETESETEAETESVSETESESEAEAEAVSVSETESVSESVSETVSETAPVPVPVVAPAGPDIIGLDLTAALPAPLDPGTFPPLPPRGPGPRRPFFEVHGFLAVWLTALQDPVPGIEERDSFRLRFTILRVDAQPIDRVRLLVRLGFMAPVNPLIDFQATWEAADEVGITVGQLRIPFGASATTAAPQLVMLDRPRYVQAMIKATFRDVGVLLHSGARGLFDGVLHYRLAVLNGGGRLGVGQPRGLNEPERFLYSARVLLDLGRLAFGGPRDRLVLAGSYARSRDPAIDTGDLAADRTLADSILGRRLTPIASERETQLGGADLTLSVEGFWAQLEWMYLDSVALDGMAHNRAQGASVELAYTLPFHPYEGASLGVALRGEYFDPSLERAGDEIGTALAGVDFTAGMGVRVGLFGGATIFRDAMQAREVPAAELELRAQYGF